MVQATKAGGFTMNKGVGEAGTRFFHLRISEISGGIDLDFTNQIILVID